MFRYVLIAATAVALVSPLPASANPLGQTSAASDSTWVAGPGIDSRNDDAQRNDGVGPTLTRGWIAESPACQDYVPDQAEVLAVTPSVTVSLDTKICGHVSAYSTATGALLWRHDPWDGAFLDSVHVAHGRVFVMDSNDYISAFQLTTGRLLWRAYGGLPDWFDEMTVGSGLIASSAWVDSTRTGNQAALFGCGQGSKESAGGVSLISGGRFYINCDDDVIAYDLATGEKVWTSTLQTAPNAPGSSDIEPALHDGRLYLRGDDQNMPTLVLDAETGQEVGTLPYSDEPITFWGNTGVFTTNPLNAPSILTAINLSTAAVEWTHTLSMVPVSKYSSEPEQLWAPPVIEDGLVWLLSGIDTGSPATVYALSLTTGAQESATSTAPCVVANGMLAIAQHRLFMSSGCGLLTFTSP